MVSGVDRYFQLARAFRDEDLRADRQPEHTQIDVEMSFVARSRDVHGRLRGHDDGDLQGGVGERPLETAVPAPDYFEAMLRFGSDKPDLRYGLEIVD